MTSRILVLLLGSAAALGVACNQTPTDAPVSPAPAGVVEAEQFCITHRVPPLIADESPDVKLCVPIVNQTAESVVFSDVVPSCACGGAELRATMLRPGERTTLDIEVNLRGRSGDQQFTVYLVDSTGRRWRCEAATTVYERLKFDAPNGLVQLGSVEPRTAVGRSILAEAYASREEALPTDFAVTGEGLRLQVERGTPRTEQVAEGVWARRLPLHVTLTTPEQAGPFGGQLAARCTSEGRQSEAILRLLGHATSLYEVSPKTIFFNQVEADGATKSRRVLVRRTDGQPVKVLSVEVSHPAVKATLQPSRSAAMALLVLTLERSAVQRPVWGEAILKTDHAKQPCVKVQFAATPDKAE